MNVSFLSESLIERIGWLLIHSLWQFALLALMLLILLRLLKQSSATLRYAFCLAALTAIVVAPIVTWQLLPVPNARQAIEVPALAVGTPLTTDAPEAATALDERPVVGSEPSLPRIDATRPQPVAASISAQAATRPASYNYGRLAAAVTPWLEELVGLWCLGVLVFAARPLWSWYLLRRLRRVGVASVVEPVTSALRRAARRLGVHRPVRVLQSTLARVPMVVGYLRPVVLLPVCVVSRLSSAEVEAILAHELAHIRRHDYLVNLWQTLVETVCFYHPAVWWLSSQMRQEREHCCDDLAVRVLGNPTAYGRALLALEELRGTAPVLSLGASGGSLLQRIRRLAQVQANPPAGVVGMLGPVLLVLLLSSGSVWTATQAQVSREVASPETQETTAAATNKSANDDTIPPIEQELSTDGVVEGVLLREADGAPVTGARIILRGQKNYYAKSDAEGRFRLEDIPPLPRQYTIWAYAGNLITSKVRPAQTISEDSRSARFAPLQLEMRTGQQVKFAVTSADTGEPLEGASVRFGYPDRRKVVTAADGTAIVEGFLPQEYDVTIEAEGYARQSSQLNLSRAAALTEHIARLDAGGIVRGVVVDDSGEPIPDAEVSYREPRTSVGFHGDAYRTDADGRFQHRFLPLNAPIEISVRADDYLSQKQEVSLVPTKREADVVVTLERRPRGGSIAGLVTNAKGDPLSGVRVENYGRRSTPHVKTTTDADGRFVLHDLAESHTEHMIHLAADGYAPQRVDVEPGTANAPNNVTVTLEPGHTIRGQILDENSKPLAGAYISPRSTAFGFGFGPLITTGDDGRFAFDSLPPDVRFDVNHDDYPGMRQVAYELDSDEPITIQFEPPGIVWGRVVDAETGKPVDQFRVRIGFSSDRRPGDATGTYNGKWGDPGLTFSSKQGRFVIKPLKAGMPVELEILAEIYERTIIARAVAAPQTDSEELTISLKRATPVEPFTLTGQFLDHAGKPAAGAQLRLIVSTNPPASSEDRKYNWVLIENSNLARKSYVEQFLSGVTNADGRFEFKDILPGKFLQLAYWGPGVPQGRSLAFEETRAGESNSITIELPEPATIRGTIERANFPNAGSIKLNVQRAAWHQYEFELREDQTTFAFENLPPGTYGVYVAAKPVEYFEDGRLFYRVSTIASQTIELQPGETQDVTFTKPDPDRRRSE